MVDRYVELLLNVLQGLEFRWLYLQRNNEDYLKVQDKLGVVLCLNPLVDILLQVNLNLIVHVLMGWLLQDNLLVVYFVWCYLLLLGIPLGV